jgi:trans-2,3-dihydro-3-hydroxyanthranilate isomerase
MNETFSELHYARCDVFTQRRYSGNPLAIVETHGELTDASMITIAREFGYSETVFLLATWRDGIVENSVTVRARIFTPTEELRFAGHPSIGTCAYLATQSEAVGTTLNKVTLILPSGPVDADIARSDQGQVLVTILIPEYPTIHDVSYQKSDLYKLCGLDIAALDTSLGPIAGVRCGPGFLFVPVRHEQLLYGMQVSHSAWQRLLMTSPFNNLYFFCRRTDTESEFEVRMFGFGIGQAEDGGTGAAAAGLACYLKTFNGFCRPGVVFQGRALGRQSRIYFSASADSHHIRIGGETVFTGQGRLIPPEPG